jgi:predicted chitinase
MKSLSWIRSSTATLSIVALFACSAEIGDTGSTSGSAAGGSQGSTLTGTGSPNATGSGTTGPSVTTGSTGVGGSFATGGTGGAAGFPGAGGALADASAGRDGSAARDAGRPDGAGGGGLADAGSGPCVLTTVLTQTLFDTIFPLNTRNALYTYDGFVSAAAAFPAFANTGTVDTCRKEVAAFLANVARETGRLRYADQIAKSQYCSTRNTCACDPATLDQTKWYYGRGPLQLSWNYNYCAAGAALGLDLLGQPGMVSTNSEVAWKTALWFWMTQQGAGNMTCHAAITGGAIFGETIRTINGGVECNQGGYGVVDGVTERVDHYIDYARRLGIVNPGLPQDLDC